jgi:hypothetical protein
MTVYINPLKPRPVDAKKVEEWLNDLDSDLFVTREAARVELRKLGNDARPALQAALKGKLTLEASHRVKSLLDRLPDFDLGDLEIPAGVRVMDASDLIGKALQELRNPDRQVRIHAVEELSALTRLSDKVVPALIEVFEKDEDLHLRQVAAACLGDAGLVAKSAEPALKRGRSVSDANIRNACQDALNRLAQAQDTPAQQEQMRREQAIAQEIQAWKNTTGAGRAGK